MDFLNSLAIEANNYGASTGTQWLTTTDEGVFEIKSPVDGKTIANVYKCNASDYQKVINSAKSAFVEWRQVPAPQRGDIVRQIGNKLREFKQPLGELVAYEMGKSLQEGLGEVQEMIDICDFAVGLSRQLNGSTLHSERPLHRMYDQYHPLGVVGVISAFNFPVAVWSWNAMIAAICGNATVWKPSEKTPLTAIACQNIIKEVLIDNKLPEGIFSLVIGDANVIGEDMLEDKNVPLVSVTGSTRVGRHAGQKVAARFGKSILELGGNNAMILTPDADLKLAVPAIVFGAVGTAGQRCTSTRRVIIHESIYDQVKAVLTKAYKGLRIGSPLDENNHVGPLIDTDSVQAFTNAIKAVKEEGGKVLCGGNVLSGEGYESGCYVEPVMIEAENHYQTVQHETFAPILYLIKYKGDVNDAIALQNDVVQGLSSAIFSNNMRECETFLSHWGSDCGIANVNIGTSGAEIGGAFGGEKETGGGRESGSDAWKAYMRRQTNTINFSTELPLAQGIKFDL
ncbi:L-piperidine-6-carboxylate dehydrogenase [Thalassotalea profundi]|uniref:aldehyde dehydrogenase (NAD(+)) n=1 Tax=Thalassotalea profundi TaxID=2036687 RepID=A0ABQ3IN96_9GAMM|nr:aldehyde dehydrogenase family protein [Thalassotalea profundi]GHE86955.1 aldehyde dehydrogenase [Thalassotalea profundi]